MSIFKSTLKPVIAAQLKAREKIVSSDVRTDAFLRYTTGKNSWVRMTSFVNYDSKVFDKKTGKLVNDNRYTGDSLSKKYILEGGTLYDKGNDKYSLRSGVGKLDGVYASSIDKINSNPNDNKVDRLYGLRPMPGITNVNIINKSAYGSLREATIQFMAWDKHQLEELEILFMRTGYTVLLEWGWSQYIDHDVPTSINNYPNIKEVKNFDKPTINPFKPGITDIDIYNKIDSDIADNKGNYDALLGYVKNFSWQLMSNGGFQCSTTLISRGEVIETLKASANPNIILGSSYTPNTTTSIAEEQKPLLSNFEKIFLNIIGKINEAEFVGSFTYGSGNTTGDVSGSLYISGSSTDDQKILRDQTDAIYDDIKTRLLSGSFADVVGTWDNYEINYAGTTGIDLDKSVVIKFCDGKTEGVGIEYIQMDTFIAIINEFFLLKNSKDKAKRPVVTIVLPGNTPCLASEDSVSIDPTTCIIQNSQATFITNQTDGFSPDLFTEVNVTSLTDNALTHIADLSKVEFLAPGTKNIGQVGKIFVSISKIIQLYRNLSGGPDGVDVLTLLQDVLDACSFSLGGINDFKLFTDRNVVQIIDAKYFENASKESKFKFDLIGLKSICRDVKINSRIFAEQSTMIAIGAGTSGANEGNLGDIYASTQTYFNAGLEDRVISATYDAGNNPTTVNYGSTVLSGSDVYYYNIFKNVDSLTNYINYNVTGVNNKQGVQQWQVTVVPQENQVINAGSLLKTVHYQLNGQDIDFKALIPFELEITLDGIGGFVIGQIFTIDKTILPRDYYNKNLGFIITGINHSLQNNDWITNIKTQICLLDNESIKDRASIDKDKLKKIIASARINQAQNGYLYCALADYIISQYVFAVTKGGSIKPNFGLISDLSSDPKKIYTVEYEINDFFPNTDNINVIKPKIQTITDYIVSQDFIEKYLENWYNAAKPLNAPNFPATFEEFKTPSNGVGTSDWNTVLKNMTELLRKPEPFDNYALGKVVKDAYWKKTASQLTKDFYEDVTKTSKQAWEATFFGQIQKGNENFLFPIKLQENGTNTIIKHIPFDKAGGIENQPFDVELTIFVGGGGTGGGSGTTITTQYGITNDSFNQLFVTFYNFIEQNKQSLGLSAYGAPAVNYVTTSTANFKVIHLEGTTN